MADSTRSGITRACTSCGQLNDAMAERCSACSELIDVPRAAPATFDDASQLLGRIVNGKYEVLSILGEGGMGVVYKVRHLILQNKNTFALKILHPRLCAQADFQTRFLREVEIAMELTHENIIQIRDFGLTEQNLLFYTMDFFGGECLKSIIDREKAIPPERAVRIARQVLLALAEAHKAGIIHRDLKPDNVLIERVDDRIDNVRILDFGIAKVLVGDSEVDEKNLTQGNVIGTPKYMSPEQASGDKIDARSDLYALGCILYEMLTGQVPFSGKTARSILVSHLTVAPPAFEQMRPGIKVPAALERLVFKLLAKNRDDRPATAEVVLDLLDGRKPDPTRHVPAAAPPKPKAKVLAIIAASVFTAAAAGFFLLPLFHREGEAQGAGEAGGSAARQAPGAEFPENAAPQPSSSAHSKAKKLRCNVCGAVYAKGAKIGDMCHGEPLVEAE